MPSEALAANGLSTQVEILAERMYFMVRQKLICHTEIVKDDVTALEASVKQSCMETNTTQTDGTDNYAGSRQSDLIQRIHWE